MTLEAILDEARSLSAEDRILLITRLAQSLTEPEPKHSLLELKGLGKHLADGEDAQDYVNRLRDEWDQ